MELKDKVVVITGAAQGIGAGLAKRFQAESPKALVLLDREADKLTTLASELSAHHFVSDVTNEQEMAQLIETIETTIGSIDLFVANAGGTSKGGIETPDDQWQHLWELNLMSHVYSARAVIPRMLERGDGYLLHTSSAAGLLTEIGSAAYSVTKHAAVAFAEWLSVEYRRSGLKVSCLCPAGVLTEFLDLDDPVHQFLATHAVTVEDLAESVVAGLQSEEFLILPQPEILEFFRNKGSDYDRWLHAFSRINQKMKRHLEKQQAAS